MIFPGIYQISTFCVNLNSLTHAAANAAYKNFLRKYTEFYNKSFH